jgi:hypothetical protein
MQNKLVQVITTRLQIIAGLADVDVGKIKAQHLTVCDVNTMKLVLLHPPGVFPYPQE